MQNNITIAVSLESRSRVRKLIRTSRYSNRHIERRKPQLLEHKEFLDSMEMLPVKAVRITAIGYCDLSHTLQVDYRDGKRHRFYGVAPLAFEQLLEVDCPEQYLGFFNRSESDYNGKFS